MTVGDPAATNASGRFDEFVSQVQKAGDLPSPEEAEQLMREGYELSIRLGMSSLGSQFVMGLVDIANQLGTADRWLAEMERIEEAEELGPFFTSGFPR